MIIRLERNSGAFGMAVVRAALLHPSWTSLPAQEPSVLQQWGQCGSSALARLGVLLC